MPCLEKKYYVVEFVYKDNNQIFQSGADMTEDEKDYMKRVLDQYAKAGAIKERAQAQARSRL